jgi:hypothetical protein
MGYTHYWYKEPTLSQKKWFDFANDFVKVLPHFYKELDSTTDQKFYINSDELFLNGVGENSHETFYFSRVEKDIKDYQKDDNSSKVFACCKTARKPYDISVCCALIIAKKHFGADIEVKSDGENDEEEWEPSKQLCQDILKYGEDFDMSYESQNNNNGGQFI